MRLTQAELIQIFRRRANMTQAELGSIAFEMTPNSGRTKIKNIELGRQLATDSDLQQIAQCLDVSVEMLQPESDTEKALSHQTEGGVLVSEKIVDMYANLRKYLELFNEAGSLNDYELIEHLARKIAGVLQSGPVDNLESSRDTANSTKASVHHGSHSGEH